MNEPTAKPTSAVSRMVGCCSKCPPRQQRSCYLLDDYSKCCRSHKAISAGFAWVAVAIGGHDFHSGGRSSRDQAVCLILTSYLILCYAHIRYSWSSMLMAEQCFGRDASQ